ncbi:MAG TPA: hypothetical protein VH333_00235 [Pseudonocardiaceae bacterium]|nr:hypothetical protein [Pseudonocardiaceae bacterium]
MTRRPGGSDGPEDVDAAFAEIVADLEREGLGASVVEANLDPTAFPDLNDLTPTDPSPTEPVGWRVPSVSWEDAVTAEEEGHYVPPDPPPLPRLRPATIFGILLMAIGVLLLAGPSLIGLAPRIATPLALVALTAGIGWLILRTRQGPPPDSGWDDGAQL